MKEASKEKMSQYLLVDSKILPDVFEKVIQVKNVFSSGKAKSINEAVKLVGISRSAYYKYKDYVFPFYDMSRGRVVTFLFVVEDLSGILSKIIKIIANSKANILTINQNIPINGLADIIISVETHDMKYSVKKLLADIGKVEGIKKSEVLARE